MMDYQCISFAIYCRNYISMSSIIIVKLVLKKTSEDMNKVLIDYLTHIALRILRN